MTTDSNITITECVYVPNSISFPRWEWKMSKPNVVCNNNKLLQTVCIVNIDFNVSPKPLLSQSLPISVPHLICAIHRVCILVAVGYLT